MIKRLKVRNFLSLKDVDLELGTNNLVVGPNMSGKSNLIDCFRFLTTMVTQGVTKAFLDRGGFQEVVWKGGDESRISIGLTIQPPPQDGVPRKEYDYETSILGGQTGAISIESEKLTVKTDGALKKLVDLKGGQGEVKREDGTVAFAPPGDPTRIALELLER
jgi:predicted ATPase